MTTVNDLMYQVFDFGYSKRRDDDLGKFTRYLNSNRLDYSIAYNEYKRDTIQVTVSGSLNDLAVLEYALFNDMIL